MHRLVHGRPADRIKPTLACDLDVWMYRKEDGQSYFIEFVDPSGSSEFAPSRSVYHTQINGVVLVFDSSNPASYNNLKKWLRELLDYGAPASLPLICVGTRSHDSQWTRRVHDPLSQYGISTLLLVSQFNSIVRPI